MAPFSRARPEERPQSCAGEEVLDHCICLSREPYSSRLNKLACAVPEPTVLVRVAVD
jgi:hypothetical protein